MSVYMAVSKGEASLSHHGIMGQKWGIRRYQNKDGSLTPEGKARYGSIENFNKVKRAITKGSVIGGPVGGAIAGAIANKKYSYGGKHVKVSGPKKINNASDTKESAHILSKEQIDSKVTLARKTGKYDMEFLERELDLYQRTGELLKGKALDDAYRKYLNSKSVAQEHANYGVKAVRNAPTNKERNEALSGAAREAKRTGVYATGFKDSSFYINPETGKPFTGKALDSAYKKWLIEQM